MFSLVTLHLSILIVTALVIFYSDHQGFLYFTGKKQTLSARFIQRSHWLVWTGLVGMIVTGVSLALPRIDYLLQTPQFYLKMGFVLVLIVNAFAIGKLSSHTEETPFRDLPKNKRQVLLISGALSAIGWLGAAIIGYFFL